MWTITSISERRPRHGSSSSLMSLRHPWSRSNPRILALAIPAPLGFDDARRATVSCLPANLRGAGGRDVPRKTQQGRGIGVFARASSGALRRRTLKQAEADPSEAGRRARLSASKYPVACPCAWTAGRVLTRASCNERAPIDRTARGGSARNPPTL